MPTIALASQNTVKIQATHNGFTAMFPNGIFDVQPVSVLSGVRAQPMSSMETLLGASNRAKAAKRARGDADYWVGIEGGLEEQNHSLAAFAWVVILAVDQAGQARSAMFFLPPTIIQLVNQGIELGEANDLVFLQSNSKQKNGAVGLLTGDVIDRTKLYEQPVMLALIPFRNPVLYPKVDANRIIF